MFLLEMFGDVGMVSLHVADEPSEKSAGLKIFPRECRDKLNGAVQNFRRVGRIGNLLGVLLLERLVLLFEMLGKHRHGRRWDMQWAECATERLNRCHHFGILPISTPFKVAERDHLDQIEQRHGFVAAEFTHLSIEIPPNGHELLAQSFLLIVASAVKIGAITWARYPYDAMFSAAGTADQPSESRTGAFALALFAIDAQTHFFVAPSWADLDGGGMNP